ncbi:MAG: NAD(P)-dependent oxidoreductase [candidate division Zixibacteria bacterium]|nr:NAD(P)-dependent oxidoreductase [candidate division Zixibacteria bacterium]
MNDNQKESVLITGANGFVGSRLCRKLLNDGFHVIAGIRENCNRELLVGLDLEFRFGDVACRETLPAMIKDVDYVIHNAGIVKAKNPDLFFKVNHFGAQNLAEVCLQNKKLKKFILISSLAAVGPSEKNKPLSEDDAPKPLTAYGRSKLAGEEAVLGFKDKLNVAIIRPPGVYGPGDKEMMAFFQIVNFRIKPYLGDLKRRLQLVHVDDLCLGISKAVQATTESGSIYFIAESQSYGYRELIKHIQQAVNKSGIPLYIPGSLLKVIASVSASIMKALGIPPMFTVEKAKEILGNWEVSTEKAKMEIGFESEISFSDGSEQTAKWYFNEGWL